MKASDIRRGHVLLVDGAPCRVMEFQHRTPGNLRAFVQVRLRGLLSGKSFDQRFSATQSVQEVRVESRPMQALYRDAAGLHAMDSGTYEEHVLDDETVGELGSWLEPGAMFSVEWLEGRAIGVEPPAAVEAQVVETAPVVRGATKTASTKPARLDNGATVQVPEFVGVGDRIRARPLDGTYLERAWRGPTYRYDLVRAVSPRPTPSSVGMCTFCRYVDRPRPPGWMCTADDVPILV